MRFKWDWTSAGCVSVRSLARKGARGGSGVDRAGLECKWTTVRDPPRKRGAQLGAQIFADVQVGDPRSATEPLEDSAYRKINTQAAHVERNRSRGLKDIKNHMRADAVSPLNNAARVNDA